MHTKIYVCKKKLKARGFIMYAYNKIFNRTSIPNDKEFWSLCSRQVKYGKLIDGSELDQLTKANFITMKQYHGVDIEVSTIKANKKLTDSHWYHGSLLNVIEHNKCNAAIINCDLIEMVDTGIELINHLMHKANYPESPKKDLMIVGNFITKTRYGITTSFEDLKLTIQNNMVEQWKVFDECYPYKGTGNSKTEMCTVIFYK